MQLLREYIDNACMLVTDRMLNRDQATLNRHNSHNHSVSDFLEDTKLSVFTRFDLFS